MVNPLPSLAPNQPFLGASLYTDSSPRYTLVYGRETSSFPAAEVVKYLGVRTLNSPPAGSSPPPITRSLSSHENIHIRVVASPSEPAINYAKIFQDLVTNVPMDRSPRLHPALVYDSVEEINLAVAAPDSPSPAVAVSSSSPRMDVSTVSSSSSVEQRTLIEKLKYLQSMIPIELINDAIKFNKTIEIPFYGENIQISNKGTVRIKLRDIGSGSFKTTSLTARLMKSSEMREAQSVVFEALSTSLPLTVMYDATQIQNELSLHAYIKKLQKEHPEMSSALSHVCSAKKIVVLRDPLFSSKGLVTEFCNGGTVDVLVKKPEQLSLMDQYFVAAQMAKGAAQLHALGIVHRDLKLDNFLVKLNPAGGLDQVKLADLGIASFIEPSKRYYLKVSPLTHRPPEYRSVEGQFNPKGDVYQLGISFLGLFLKKSTEEWMKIHLDAGSRGIQEHINNLPNEVVRTFIMRMIDPHPEARPTMNEVAEFFEGLRSGY